MDLVTIPSSEAHVQTPQYGEYPYASVQSHHPGSGSHGQLFCPHENSSGWHSPRREVSLAFIDPAGYYRGEYRLSQSPSPLISGSGSLPHREGLLSPATRQICRRNFPPVSLIQSRTVLLMRKLIKPDHAG